MAYLLENIISNKNIIKIKKITGKYNKIACYTHWDSHNAVGWHNALFLHTPKDCVDAAPTGIVVNLKWCIHWSHIGQLDPFLHRLANGNCVKVDDRFQFLTSVAPLGLRCATAIHHQMGVLSCNVPDGHGWGINQWKVIKTHHGQLQKHPWNTLLSVVSVVLSQF